jgi:hypothetical protein
MKKLIAIALILMTLSCASGGSSSVGASGNGNTAQGNLPAVANSYEVVSTGVHDYFDDFTQIQEPSPGEPFYGQDANYPGIEFSYQDNEDGTVTDLNTGLMWEQTPNLGDKMSWDDSIDYCDEATTGGYEDWRAPTIKELVSITDFTGNINTATPYLDTDYFDFEYPDPSTGDRDIDAQYVSNNVYVSTVFDGQSCFFGFNFADGRIKCYPLDGPQDWYVRCVRGQTEYGENDFTDNGDGTVTDMATGLMWQQSDDGVARNWEDALAYAEELELAGYDDWRLPNIKELQSIADYSRDDPAIDPIFETADTGGWFWSSTTAYEQIDFAMYMAFGKATDYRGVDVHGAGAMRSDPKAGDPADYPTGHGPQNDEIRAFNYVRAVRTL